MTSPDSGNRPGRIAGVALLGLAAVALVLGLITVFGGNGDGRADGNGEEQPPRPTATRSSTTPRPPSSASTTIRPPSSAPTTTTTTATSPSQPPGGDGNGEPSKSTPLRVLNNSKIKGLATKAKTDFEAGGWQVVEVGNYSATNVPTTTAYYRPGTAAEEAAAKALAATFGMEAAPRIPEIANMQPGVVVIVTNDYTGAPGSGSGGGKNEG